MLRKIIFPVIAALALVATMAAAGYSALVTNNSVAVVGNTAIANLAFTPVGTVGDAFINPDTNPLQIKMDFGTVQPNSNYNWTGVLQIQNNESFPVTIRVYNDGSETQLHNLNANHTDLRIRIDDASGNYWQRYFDQYGAHTDAFGGAGASSAGVVVPAGGTVVVSFSLFVYGNAAAGSFDNIPLTFFAAS